MVKRGKAVKRRPAPRKKIARAKRTRVGPTANERLTAVRRKLAERTRELRESLEQQAAMAEVLKAINRSAFELNDVFDTLLSASARLCAADNAYIYLLQGEAYRLAACNGFTREYEEFLKQRAIVPGRDTLVARTSLERHIVHIPDVLADKEYRYVEAQQRGGFRTMLGIPMLRDGTVVGVLSLTRSTVNPFKERQIALVQTFADQAMIAIQNARLFEQVQTRTHELQASLQQQTATADVLKLISRSAFDLPTVLSTLLETAARLCEADFGNVAGPAHDGLFRVEATHGTSPEFAEAIKKTPMRPGRGSAMGRALEEKTTIHILDAVADPEYELNDTVRIDGFRTLLGIPLLRDGTAIGVFAVGRRTVRAFTEKQIELVTTFAHQAAIAIENVRLFNETKEALDRQTATAEILRVISGSPTDTQPVFDAIVQCGFRLFANAAISIALPDGDQVKAVAVAEPDPDRADAWWKRFPFPHTHEYMHSVAILEGREVDVPDVLEAPPSMAVGARNFLGSGYRAVTIMPMMREGKAIGALSVIRIAPGPLTSNQRAMLKTFADQAVIAIENTRLLNELRQRTDDLSEALEQQTAIGDILSTISGSPGDLSPVFKTVVRHAARICEADIVDIILAAGETLDVAETFGEAGRPIGEATPLDRTTVMGRTICDRAIVHIADLQSEAHDLPRGRELAVRYGHRTILGMPLIREERALGAILVRRMEVRPFEDKHVDLLRTFAEQAAIAIENARLVNELRQRTDDLGEALQQQTATSDVLKVISRSAFDLQTVFRTLVESAARLCEADLANIWRPAETGGTGYYLAAGFGVSNRSREMSENISYLEGIRIEPGRGSMVGRVLLEGKTVQIRDAQADPEYALSEIVRIGDYRTMLGVPLLRDGAPVGVIVVTRCTVRPFSEKQIELVQTFADQAVIAIENARLFNEVQARTEDLRESLQQQTATADVLKVISRSTFDLAAVLDTLVKSAGVLCESDSGIIRRRDGDTYPIAATFGLDERQRGHFEGYPSKPDRGAVFGRAILSRRTVHVPDILGDPEYNRPRLQDFVSVRTALGVPLMREGAIVGVFTLQRREQRPFSQKQIELVETFADQAVIAIENARLFSEVQARTEDLRESLQQQTATAEVLKVISRSAFDLQRVLQTLLESAVRLAEADSGTIARQYDGVFYRAEAFGFSPEFLDVAKRLPVTASRDSAASRALLEGRVVQIEDVLADPDYTFPRTMGLDSFRTALGVPILRDKTPIGVLALTRSEMRPFTDKQIELVSTFADQAAIAIENSRLFEEVQQRSRELSQSLEDLRMAQDRLVQTEKLASLGQLTAGIAHEIKNPLNFVNNFSALSGELIDELNEILSKAALDEAMRGQIDELAHMLKGNLDKVVQHGRRADSIVKNMLLHSRQGSGEQQAADINAIVEESLNLAYHGARAERKGFNITLERRFDPAAGTVEIFPQEITRVLLNLISNGFYAAMKRKEADGRDFEPVLYATTRGLDDRVEIRIRDNGAGIPPEVREKIFNPFFTTKPAGEGTGLGLSMSHDIIVKQHGGSIDVDSRTGEFTEFVITLPRAGSRLQAGAAEPGVPIEAGGFA